MTFQRSRLRRPISKIRMVLLMDAKIWMTSLISMFAVRPTCVQDSLFKMSSESPAFVPCLVPGQNHKSRYVCEDDDNGCYISSLFCCSGRSTIFQPFVYYRFLTLRYASRRNPYCRSETQSGFNVISISVLYTDGLVQDRGNSIALAVELLQFCTKP